MEFILTYRGPLKSNGKPKEKHQIRCAFHPQLKRLWDQLPLKNYKQFITIPPSYKPKNVIEEHHGFYFAPLVSEKLNFITHIRVLLLRTEEPGSLIAQSGDLDNRIKTLLDALKIPREASALPSGTVPDEAQIPFFCLLQDDSLITKLSIEADRLLDPVKDISEVLALIRVKLASTKALL
jgi:hypothetical protein